MKSLLLILLLSLMSAITYSQTAVVIGDNAYLRGSPAEAGAVVDTLLPGTKVAMIKQQGPWFLVQASPFVGWMHGNFLRLNRVAKAAAATSSPTKSNAKAAASEPVSAPAGAKPETEAPATASRPKTSVTAGQPSALDKRTYIRGPRGGCYYVRPDGRKVYGDHNLCN